MPFSSLFSYMQTSDTHFLNGVAIHILFYSFIIRLTKEPEHFPMLISVLQYYLTPSIVLHRTAVT